MIPLTDIPKLSAQRFEALRMAVLWPNPDINLPPLDLDTALKDYFFYIRLQRSEGFKERLGRQAFVFWQMWKTYNDALNRTTETAFDYQRVISLVTGPLGYCKGGRPLVPGLICPHCDLDTSDDYECPKPRRFNV